jgi:ComF family protein
VRPVIDAVLRFLYPPACPACRGPSADDELCADCAPILPLARGLVVPDCLAALPVVVACRYAGLIRDLVIELKFARDPHPSRALGALLRAAVAATPEAASSDAIVPIPLSRRRLRRRGFNQAALIAAPVAAALGTPLLPGLLRRPRHAPPQAGLGPGERARNVSFAFEPSDGLFGRAVLLVDDVITTGHTMAEAAAAVLRGGARRVACAAVAASGWEQGGLLRSDRAIAGIPPASDPEAG